MMEWRDLKFKMMCISVLSYSWQTEQLGEFDWSGEWGVAKGQVWLSSLAWTVEYPNLLILIWKTKQTYVDGNRYFYVKCGVKCDMDNSFHQ